MNSLNAAWAEMRGRIDQSFAHTLHTIKKRRDPQIQDKPQANAPHPFLDAVKAKAIKVWPWESKKRPNEKESQHD